MKGPYQQTPWNSGGTPRRTTPSYPGAGQAGTGYGASRPSTAGTYGGAPTGWSGSGVPGNAGSGWGKFTPPATGWGTGWQTQIQPMSPQIDPLMLQDQMRRMQLQQQQAQQQAMMQQQMFGMGGVQSPYGQGFTQPFQTTPPWQQRVPQNFNQGAAYGPFVRRW